ncbi:MAG: beta-hydroxyacyl-ACP dehydratase [Bacteroidales bacterium]|nr:beta-hydroxyacyl-ACP dehydratase [Bacteroidales bacterium]
MKLRNSLYKIEAEEILSTNDARVDFVLLPDCPIYRAHFPYQPITPGVCIIQLIKEMAEGIKDTSLNVTAVKNAKFLQPLEPMGTLLSVSLHFDRIDREMDPIKFAIKAEIKDSKTTYAKISLQATCA